MDNRVRLAIGFLGNAASLLLFTTPVLTFWTVIRRTSTEGYSSMPYILALLNCLLYTWYRLPVVTSRWENLLVVTINGVGILFELSFVIIYFCFTSAKGKMKVGDMVTLLMLVFCATAAISAFVFHDHQHRKVFVGSVALVASVVMYGSPLVALKKVIQTKGVEFMPFHLSFFSLLASSLWMAYGLLGHDLFLASPNIISCPLAILQLLVYCYYRRSTNTSATLGD